MKKNVENTIPLQIGLTALKFDPDKNNYVGSAYTFYVKPALFSHVNKYFHFETSAIEFLSLHHFDFNKVTTIFVNIMYRVFNSIFSQCFYHGIPYLSRIQEKDLRMRLENEMIFETNMNFVGDIRPLLDTVLQEIDEWYKQAKSGEMLFLKNLSKKYECDIEFKFYFHKYIRRNFPNVWVLQNETLTLKKVDAEEFSKLDKESNFNDEIIDSLLGFGKIYQLLVSLKKPIIAHNALMDILVLITNFEGNLPNTYEDFKKLTTKLFPVIFDTKHIYYDFKRKIPEGIRPDYSDLKSLYQFFSDGKGRHIALMDTTSIQIQGDHVSIGKFHDAGWDSFCTGYIFIRLAYLEICKKYPSGKVFMPTEYLKGMLQYKNKVNIIRCSVDNIVSSFVRVLCFY